MFKDLNIGPVEILFDGTSLGETNGGAKLTYSESEVSTHVDRNGVSPRGRYITGTDCKVTGAIAEATLTQIGKVAGQTVTEGATTDELVRSDSTGLNLIDSSGVCILKPIISKVTSTDESKWVTIPKATIKPAFDVSHDFTNQQDWGFEIVGHPVTAEDVASGGDLAGLGYTAGDILKLGNAD